MVAAWSGRDARIKWPNDVRVDGRKIAGILVERGPGAVIGIGLNVNIRLDQFPDELRDSATSLRILTGTHADRSELARALIERLEEFVDIEVARGALVEESAAWESGIDALANDDDDMAA